LHVIQQMVTPGNAHNVVNRPGSPVW